MSWLLVLILLVSVTGASAVAQMHRHAIAAVIVLVAIASGNPANAQVIRTYNNSTDSATNAINDTSAPCNNRFTRTFSVTEASALQMSMSASLPRIPTAAIS